MAKDFSQYNNDNPVMSMLNKAQQAKEEQEKINQQAAAEQAAKETSAAETSSSGEEEQVEIRKTLMNISIRETTKKEWKMFFLEHDLSMTQGIETAVEYLMDEVRKHNIKLSKGGITK